MIDGRLFLAIAALMCLGLFASGLRFARMTRNPWAGKRLFGMPVEGGDMSVERVRMIGRLQMLGASVFLLFAAALSFGLLGPSNIHPIQFVPE